MSFEANDKHIYDLLTKNTYQIPRNQRKYVWNKRNWEELFDDINLVLENTMDSHFIGSIVLKDEGRKNGIQEYTIIDGQQRIITITILLTSLLYWFRILDFKNDFEGTKQYVIAKDDKYEDVIMVKSDSQDTLEKMINLVIQMDIDDLKKKSISSLAEQCIVKSTDKKICEVFKYFSLKIQNKLDLIEELDKKRDYLIKLRDTIVGIIYVSIISSTEEDSYTIFEILNARGIDLEDHELLKNYIMRYMIPKESRDKAKEKWNDMEKTLKNDIGRFITHYTIHKYGYSRELSNYKQIQLKNKKDNVANLLDDLFLKSSFYEKFINPTKDSTGNCNEVEFRVFSFFKKKRYWQMRPVLLSLMNKFKQGIITVDLYNEVIQYLQNFYICYNVIGEQNSNKLTNCINKYALKIENDFNDNTLTEFTTELMTKMPSYEVFLNNFKTIGWSHHHNFFEGEKNKDRVHTVLEVIERYKNNQYCCEDLTIEHVLNDCESADNAIIGNLLPLENKLNDKCNGLDFNGKIQIYKNSNFIMTRNFGNRYNSRESFVPKNRTEIMAREFYYNILKFKD